MEQTKKKIDIWSIFIYLILYSIAGFVIETTFGIFTKGVIESRKSFLYGPFCAIYGIGAISMILFLKNENKIWKIFIYGAIIGAIVEYLMSFFCEKFFGVKWWDYSEYFLNIGGRTCIAYALSWGLLGIFLMKFVNPYVDKFINIVNEKNNIFKVVTILIIGFFTVDSIITGYALKAFYYRVSIENNLNVENKNNVIQKYEKMQNTSNLLGIVGNYYNDEKMLKTYPNMMISENNNENIYIDSLFGEIKSYYYRLSDAF